MPALIDRLFARRASPQPAARGGVGFWNWFTGSLFASDDADAALNFSAVFAAVDLRGNSLKSLPWAVFERVSDKENKPARKHPVFKLLHTEPNPEVKPGGFKKYLLGCRDLWGNAYAEIERDRANRPIALWPIHPSRVEVSRRPDGSLFYGVANNNGRRVPIRAADMFHVMGYSIDGIQGLSVVGLARRSIGMGLAAEQHGETFYANNAQPGVVLQHPLVLSEPAQKRLRHSWREAYGGTNRYGLFVAEEGMDVKTLGMPHTDAQFLETRTFQVVEIARWFNVPPHKLRELSRATFSNIEHQAIEYVTDSVLPETIEFEEEANRKLFNAAGRERFFTKLSTNALMRGDSKARGDFYKTMVAMGVLSINEVRALEEQNGIGKAGDAHFVPLNMTTAEALVEDAKEPKPETPAPQPPGAPVEPETPDVGEDVDGIVEESIARVRRKERKRKKWAQQKYGGNLEGYVAWRAAFYDALELELIATAGDVMAVKFKLSGHSESAAKLAAQRQCADIVGKWRAE